MFSATSRIKHVKHAVRDVVAAAQKIEQEGHDVIYLNIGDPLVYDFTTPQHLLDSVVKKLPQSSGYANALGLQEAREAVAREAKRLGIQNVETNDVVMTQGGSEAIPMAIGGVMNAGENILLPKPGYSLYNAVINYHEGEINEYQLDENDNWQPDIDDMRKHINDKTSAITLINPNNPTGAVYTRSTLKKVIDLAGEYDIPVFSDETYDKIIFDEEDSFTSVGSLTQDVDVVTFNTLSKNYLCPGWRVGWAIFSGPNKDAVAEPVKQLARVRLSINHPMQHAVQPALEGPQDHTKEAVAKLKKRRDLTYKRLNEIDGISCVKPKGAFYAFPKFDHAIDDKDFVMNFLHEHKVLFVHGSGFSCPGHFRVVFGASEDALTTAFDRLETYVKKL